VEKYRTAHGIAQASERGEASTEDLRHSVRHYRALFVELLEVQDGGDVDDEMRRRDLSNVQRLG
jgi:pyridoxal biosynthesis lyase PdxS